MEVQTLEQEEKIERGKVLRLVGKVILMIVSLGVTLIGSIIISGEIGVVTYRILGIPANFRMLWGLSLINYISVTGGEQYLIPVILSRGLGTFAIFIGLWYLIRKLKGSRKLIFEPWLLIMGPFQFFIALSVIPNLYTRYDLFLTNPALYYGLNVLEGILILIGTVGVVVFVFFRCHYYEKVKNWL